MSDDQIVQDMTNFFSKTIGQTKASASLWGTLRWLTNLVFLMAWMLALPLELLLNRRIGRRYMGLAPFWVSMVILAVGFATMHAEGLKAAQGARVRNSSAAWGHPNIRTGAGGAEVGGGALAAIPAAPTRDPIAILALIYLSTFAHRAANWMRFRTTDQVHSFSCGVPWWLHPPRKLFAWLPAAPAAPLPENSVPEVKPGSGAAEKPHTPAFTAVLNFTTLAPIIRELKSLAGAECKQLFSDWRAGRPPVGTVAWIGSTVIHPVLVFAAGLIIMAFSVPLGLWMQLAAVAIFIKGRIEKALAVEMVYDIFDGRIAQQFQRALSEPQELNRVERTGFAVPGVARMMAMGTAANSGPRTLPPDLAELMKPATGKLEMGASSTPQAIAGPGLEDSTKR